MSLARRRLHRAPPSGTPFGRAGQDRPQEHWRPVPARREPERAGQGPWTPSLKTVNKVGVDLNTAPAPCSPACRARPAWRRASSRWRDAARRLPQPAAVARTSRALAPSTFEQSAGFLRIRDGDNPLDWSSVHPETHPLCRARTALLKRPAAEVTGQQRCTKPESSFDECSALSPLNTCWRSWKSLAVIPRPDFVALQRRRSRTCATRKPAMALEGTVSNVAQFGAFVDLGVHQDGPRSCQPAQPQVRQRRARSGQDG